MFKNLKSLFTLVNYFSFTKYPNFLLINYKGKAGLVLYDNGDIDIVSKGSISIDTDKYLFLNTSPKDKMEIVKQKKDNVTNNEPRCSKSR